MPRRANEGGLMPAEARATQAGEAALPAGDARFCEAFEVGSGEAGPPDHVITTGS